MNERIAVHIWPPDDWCAETNPAGTHICDKPRGHQGDHSGPEMPTVDIDEGGWDMFDHVEAEGDERMEQIKREITPR